MLNKVVEFWNKEPPEPVYDSTVRVKSSKAPQIIVGMIALTWVLSNVWFYIERGF